MKLAIAIRISGERTTDACLYYVRKYAPAGTPIAVINRAPFVAALRASYEAGIDAGADYLMTVDADVILLPNAIDTFLRDAEQRPKLVERHASCHCALMQTPRHVGPRLYLGRHLSALRDNIRANRLRPESETLKPYRARKQCAAIDAVIGLHDFGQWRRDLYRKGALYAKKNGPLPNPVDHPNYDAFYQGAADHKRYSVVDLLNRETWPDCDIPEREPMLPPYDAAVAQWLDAKVDTQC